jgi:hypothetical protein
MHAAWSGQVAVLKVFRSRLPGDALLRSHEGFTALHYACEAGRLEVVRWAMMEEAEEDGAPDAAAADDDGLTMPNLSDDSGFCCPWVGGRWLAAHGADFSVVTDEGATPLMLAW